MKRFQQIFSLFFPWRPTVRNERGFALVGAIAAMVIFGAIGAGIFSMSKTSTFTQIEANHRNHAVQLAKSGLNFAKKKVEVEQVADPSSLNGTYTLKNGESFTLALSPVEGQTGKFSVISTGTVARGGGLSSSFIETDYVQAAGNSPIDSDDGDFADFDIAGTGIEKDGTDSISFGNKESHSSGAIWYTGPKYRDKDGNYICENGLRAYFQFEFNRDVSEGDGFVFVVRSQETGRKDDYGGSPSNWAAPKRMGELLGYAGPGNSGRGVPAPKFGLEFDIFHNPGNGKSWEPGSREDKTPSDHMAFVYWGNNQREKGSTTWDDNRHGRGIIASRTTPQNAANLTDSFLGSDSYLYGIKNSSGNYGTNARWLKNGGVLNCRVEINRHDGGQYGPNQAPYYYELKAWISKTVPGGYDDVTEDYLGSPPDMREVIALSEEEHRQMKNIWVGFTQGTGAATQILTIYKLKLAFRSDPPPPVALPSDYVGRWTFDEASGNVAHDMSPYKNDAAIHTLLQNPFLGGKNGAALNNSHYYPAHARAEAGESLDLTRSGTIMSWVWLHRQSEWGGIVHKGDYQYGEFGENFADEAYSLQFWNEPLENGGRPVYLVIRDRQCQGWGNGNGNSNGNGNGWGWGWGRCKDNTRGGVHWNGNGYGHGKCTCRFPYSTIKSRTKIRPGQWYLVAATWDADKRRMRMYVDGVLEAEKTLTHPAQDTYGGLNIGCQLMDGRYRVNGLVDEVVLYDRELTPQEIRAWHQFSSCGYTTKN